MHLCPHFLWILKDYAEIFFQIVAEHVFCFVLFFC